MFEATFSNLFTGRSRSPCMADSPVRARKNTLTIVASKASIMVLCCLIGSCLINDTKYQHKRRRRRAYLRYAHDESSKCNPTNMSHCTSPGVLKILDFLVPLYILFFQT